MIINEVLKDFGGGGLTRPIARDEGVGQLDRVLIIGQSPRDKTRGLEW